MWREQSVWRGGKQHSHPTGKQLSCTEINILFIKEAGLRNALYTPLHSLDACPVGWGSPQTPLFHLHKAGTELINILTCGTDHLPVLMGHLHYLKVVHGKDLITWQFYSQMCSYNQGVHVYEGCTTQHSQASLENRLSIQLKVMLQKC